MSTISFTPSQQAAIRAFEAFLNGPKQVFLLKGAAGTGKTTLLLEFLKILDERKLTVGLMAPTGRAAHIIASKTKRAATTIHRGIYALANLKSTNPNAESDIDAALHAKFGLRDNDAPLDAVYIVDESSMISDSFSENEAFSFGSGQLLTDLFEYAGCRKIVFVGDYAQLPPVGMNFSPALDKEYIEQSFRCMAEEYTLREVLRQADDSMILRNATTLRDRIERKSFVAFSLDDGADSFAENDNLLRPYFEIHPEKPSPKSAIIAHSNRQALQLNLAIRRHYFGDDAPRLKKGDLLMIARNNYAFDAELFNGNIVEVESCGADAEVVARTVRVKLGKDHYETVDLRFRKATIRFNAAGEATSLSVNLLDNFLDDPKGAVGGLLARALILDFENRLPADVKRNLPLIKRSLRTNEHLSQEERELQDQYMKHLQKDPFYNCVICKYGYAMTCHKAQGGEWDNVFVDMCRFGGTANEDYFRWAYTALTRAAKRLWHYRSPDFNYISDIVVEPIQPSANIKVSNYAESGDFLDSRFQRIKKLADKAGINVADDRSRAYQHRLRFTGSNGDHAEFTLWYKAKGYSGKDILQQSTGDDFASLCRRIIADSLAPDSVPFAAPTRPFAEKLVGFVKTQLEELDIRLLNITQERYQDVFHLKTDGLAKMAFYYTDKGNYTHMALLSSLGPDDQKLEALRQRFT